MILISLKNKAGNIVRVNDETDFSMPYRNAGKFDQEVMLNKYMGLNKQSKGLIVRLGFFNG